MLTPLTTAPRRHNVQIRATQLVDVLKDLKYSDLPTWNLVSSQLCSNKLPKLIMWPMHGRRWLWCMLYIPSWSCGQWSSMVVVHVIYSKLIMWPMVVDGCGACYIFQADHVANGRRWLWCMLYIPSWSCGQWSSMVVVHVIYSKLIMWPMVVDGCGACYIFQADHVANASSMVVVVIYSKVHVIYSKLIMWPMVVDGCGACYIFQADHVANAWSSMVVVHVIYSKLIMWPMVVDGCGACYIFQADHVANGRRWLWCMLYIPSWSCGQCMVVDGCGACYIFQADHVAKWSSMVVVHVIYSKLIMWPMVVDGCGACYIFQTDHVANAWSSMVVVHVIYSKLIMWPMVVDGCGACYIFQADHVANGRRWLWCMLYIPSWSCGQWSSMVVVHVIYSKLIMWPMVVDGCGACYIFQADHVANGRRWLWCMLYIPSWSCGQWSSMVVVHVIYSKLIMWPMVVDGCGACYIFQADHVANAMVVDGCGACYIFQADHVANGRRWLWCMLYIPSWSCGQWSSMVVVHVIYSKLIMWPMVVDGCGACYIFQADHVANGRRWLWCMLYIPSWSCGQWSSMVVVHVIYSKLIMWPMVVDGCGACYIFQADHVANGRRWLWCMLYIPSWSCGQWSSMVVVHVIYSKLIMWPMVVDGCGACYIFQADHVANGRRWLWCMLYIPSWSCGQWSSMVVVHVIYSKLIMWPMVVDGCGACYIFQADHVANGRRWLWCMLYIPSWSCGQWSSMVVVHVIYSKLIMWPMVVDGCGACYIFQADHVANGRRWLWCMLYIPSWSCGQWSSMVVVHVIYSKLIMWPMVVDGCGACYIFQADHVANGRRWLWCMLYIPSWSCGQWSSMVVVHVIYSKLIMWPMVVDGCGACYIFQADHVANGRRWLWCMLYIPSWSCGQWSSMVVVHVIYSKLIMWPMVVDGCGACYIFQADHVANGRRWLWCMLYIPSWSCGQWSSMVVVHVIYSKLIMWPMVVDGCGACYIFQADHVANGRRWLWCMLYIPSWSCGQWSSMVVVHVIYSKLIMWPMVVDGCGACYIFQADHVANGRRWLWCMLYIPSWSCGQWSSMVVVHVIYSKLIMWPMVVDGCGACYIFQADHVANGRRWLWCMLYIPSWSCGQWSSMVVVHVIYSKLIMWPMVVDGCGACYIFQADHVANGRRWLWCMLYIPSWSCGQWSSMVVVHVIYSKLIMWPMVVDGCGACYIFQADHVDPMVVDGCGACYIFQADHVANGRRWLWCMLYIPSWSCGQWSSMVVVHVIYSKLIMWPMVVDGCGACYIFQADHVANGRRWLWCMLYIPSWSCGQWSSMVVVHVIYSKLIMWPMVVDGCGACYIFQADHVANGRRWLWCMLYIPSWSCGQWSSMVVVHVIYSKLIMWPMVVDGCGACYIFQADHVANGRRWLWCMLYIPSWSCGQWSSMVVVHVIYSKLIMWPMVVDGCGACYIFQADHVANGRRWLWCMLYIPSWSCGQWSSMVVVHVIYSKLIMWPMVVDGCGACYIFQADHVANGRRWLWCMLYIPSWSCGQWSSMVVVHVIYSKLIMWPMVVDGCGASYIFQADHVANGRRWLWCMLYIPS